MKKICSLLIILTILLSCNSNTHNDKIKERTRLDSIARADSIQALFSQQVLSKKFSFEDYPIKKLVKMLLADNKDIYIPKEEINTRYFYVDIFNSDERNGSIVIIYFDQQKNSVLKLVVTETQHNITEEGYETAYLCKNPVDENTYKLTKVQSKNGIYFYFESDYNATRQKFMESLLLVAE